MLTRTLIMLCALAFSARAMTGEEILRKMDRNRDHSTVQATGRMEIHIGDEVRTKTMVIKGMPQKSRSIVKFTNPEDDGAKYLMLDDNLWIYFAEEQDVVKISGHMLKEGMMGSDVSYEDALEADKLTEKYAVEVTGEETLEGRPCYVVELSATTRDAPYYRRTMWVDKESFVAWKEQMYAKSGKLLKQSRVLEVSTIGEREFATKTEMVNKLRRNSKTVFTLSDVVLDKPLDEDLFTMRYLRR